MSAYEFPWEQRARRGEELPEGLDLPNQWAYLAVRTLYADYGDNHLTREQASAEKRKIRRGYEEAVKTMTQWGRYMDYHARQHRAVEQVVTAVRKEPTPANALRLCDVLDGLERMVTG